MPKKTLGETEQKLAMASAYKNFMIARSEAINNFANVETYLAKLLTTLLGADLMQGSKLFSEIINTRARLTLISSLFKIKYGEQHREFFGSLLSHLETIAGSRNKIVHWLLVTSTTGGKAANPKKDVFLCEHPDMFMDGKLYLHEVRDFSRKTDFIGLLLYYFDLYLTHPAFAGDPNKCPWPEIFSNKISYPPPQGHQLYERHKAWRGQEIAS